MDRILKYLLTEFAGGNEIDTNDFTDEFERFVNYSVVANEYNREFDVDSVSVGAGDDTGIDGIAIIVNGQLVDSIEEIDDLLRSNNYIEATFIFIQAKTSPKFNGSDMNNFSFGVKDFFAETPRLRRNSDIRQFAELSDYLLTKASSFRQNPSCRLYYATSGTWGNDQNHHAVVESVMEDLSNLGLFSELEFHAMGANEISKLYRETKNLSRATFAFADKVTLPDLPEVREAYYGILPLAEFKKILVDENGNFRNIFYDNVRDYQGATNPTNSNIASTLDSDDRELFYCAE